MYCKKVLCCVGALLLAAVPVLAGDVSPMAAGPSTAANYVRPAQDRMAPCDGADVVYNVGVGYDGVNGLADQRGGAVADAWIVDDAVLAGQTTVNDVHWWTVDDSTFAWGGTDDIVIYGALGSGGPDVNNVIFSQNDIPNTRQDTGNILFGRTVYLYTITGLNVVLAPGTYYIGVRPVSGGTGGQSFILTAPADTTGQIWFQSNYFGFPNFVPGDTIFGAQYNMAFCLTGSTIPVFGACCIDSIPDCQDNFPAVDCIAAGGRFAADTLCVNLVPPCGELPGACCYDNGFCTLVTAEHCGSGGAGLGDANCDGVVNFDDINFFVEVLSGGSVPGCPEGNCDCNQDGDVNFDDINYFVAILSGGQGSVGTYLGTGTTCNQCPCIVPKIGTPEGEPCNTDTNGGCNSAPPIFGSISCGETIWGTSYFDGSTRDTDWFRIDTSLSYRFTITSVAEFANQLIFITDAGADCVGYSYVYVQTGPCVPAVITTDCLGPNTYYVWEGPQFTTVFACTEDNAQYHVKLECEPCYIPLGACCKSGVCYPDMSQADCTAMGGTWQGVNTGCDPNPCPACAACPPGSTPEGEPCNTDTNGGCNSAPPIFGAIACGETICGTSYFDGATRDTDWFRIDTTQAYSFTVTAAAKFDLQLLLIADAGADCVGYSYLYTVAAACDTATIVSPGDPASTYYVWVGPQFTNLFTCTEGDPQYWVHLECTLVPSGACCKSGICYDAYTLDSCNAINGQYMGDGVQCQNITCPAAPPGDTCEDPILLTGVPPLSGSGDSCLYTNNYTGSCGAATSPDVVYAWVANTTAGAVNVSLCGSSYDTVLFIYAGDCNGSQIACNDDSSCGLQSQINDLAVTNGTTYFFVVSGYSSSSCGAYVISITEAAPPPPAPANDLCANAEAISPPYPVTVFGTTLGATVDCPGVLGWTAVWYKVYLPNANNNVLVTYCGTSEGLSTVGIVYYDMCDDCPNYHIVSGYTWNSCSAGGGYGIDMYWNAVSGPRDIWIPAYVVGATGGMDFNATFTVNAAAPGPQGPAQGTSPSLSVPTSKHAPVNVTGAKAQASE